MLLDRYRDKVVSVEDLMGIIGPRPRDKRVVLCVGVFDVVHPGHLRHLLYAAERGDVLVCGVTGDEFVNKGPYQPHVPQDVRALNLAAFDFVDYVFIGTAPRPDEILAMVKPDVYAKGFEYQASWRGGRAIKEVDVVERYGGEVLYTPGDFVMSSSALTAGSPVPGVHLDKLELVLSRAGITFSDLRNTLQAFRDVTVHVVGDVIVDRLTECTMVGARGKTPTISVRRGKSRDFVGGAGIVARHVRAAGATALLSTVVGDDDLGMWAVGQLREAGVAVNVVRDRDRPTTLKDAIVVEGYRTLKIDTVDNRPVIGAALELIVDMIRYTSSDVVIFSDFRHGVFNSANVDTLIDAIAPGTVRVADSQVASRWGSVLDFPAFDLIAANELEARFALADQDTGVRALGARLVAEADAKWLLLKLGSRGLFGFEKQSCLNLDSLAAPNDVVDAVGAGDALLAYASLSRFVRPGDLATAAILGSCAAAVAVTYDGNVPISADAVASKLGEIEACLTT